MHACPSLHRHSLLTCILQSRYIQNTAFKYHMYNIIITSLNICLDWLNTCSLKASRKSNVHRHRHNDIIFIVILNRAIEIIIICKSGALGKRFICSVILVCAFYLFFYLIAQLSFCRVVNLLQT
jgi:hypothetical protein